MKILEHCDNEYYITMRADTDLDSLGPGLDALVEDEEDNPNGIITDWEDTEFDAVLSKMCSVFKDPGKAIHIYIGPEHDNEESWKRIGNTIGMSLEELSCAKKLMDRVYRAYFETDWDDDYEPSKEDLQEELDVKARGLTLVPKNSLWSKPLPGAQKVRDYDGEMIKLGRLDQLLQDREHILDMVCYEVLFFYLDPEADLTDLIQEIESLLLQTEEA